MRQFVKGDRVQHKTPSLPFVAKSFTGGGTVDSVENYGQNVWVILDGNGSRAVYPADVPEFKTD